MIKYAYRYLRVDVPEVDATLEVYANAGYRVVSFNRNPNASMVDILVEREVDN